MTTHDGNRSGFGLAGELFMRLEQDAVSLLDQPFIGHHCQTLFILLGGCREESLQGSLLISQNTFRGQLCHAQGVDRP